ncbi:HDOD domain-containing protein [Desulfovibrio sp. JC022]|uniref:HDOD domain-containing protein n=1 Tax=Desulfovibrio sp. JC022 TaxID=2593642 RepID=UPI0013D1B3B9|nr:HDOD domain-containing protein [Desulfovibrio sp. JC022]NDV22090.1 HDOD domain-containing protein [Desulfovibrio sp. JC022]
MQEVEQTTTLNPQIKDAAIKYVRNLFSQADDSEFIRMLKKEAFKNVYKKMVVEPDEFMARPRPADIEPWSGAKPDSPQDFLKSKVVLPSLPQVLLEIQKVIKDPDSSADDLAEVLNKDPKLVASILRLANSAMYSFRTEVDTTSRAVALLGFKQASSLALGTVSLSLFKRSEGVQVLQVEKFWKHAIACGVIAQEIAKLAGIQDTERFFVAGMLHDIGLYVIFESDKSLGLELYELARKNGNSLYDAEMELLGFDHAALGGVIIRDWNFPKSLVVAAAAHHNPNKAKKDPDAGIIHVADFISRALGYHLGLSTVLGVLDQEIYESFGLSGDMFVDMVPEVQKMIEEIFEILNPA